MHRIGVTKMIKKISTNLWFNIEAEEVANFYVSIFKNSNIEKVTRYGKERHELEGLSQGDVMTVEFQLEGQSFVALNGGPLYKFTEAISFIVNCDSQEEIDYFWDRLSEGGEKKAQVCGWLKDRYGVSWQIVPTILNDLITGDSSKSERVMKVLLQMKKINIEQLVRAYNEE